MFKALLVALLVTQSAPAAGRNTWAAQYKKGSAESFAARFEEPSREIFRYRAAITGMLQLKPGMSVGEVGAGSGFLSRFIAGKVGPVGQVYANELEPKMVQYMTGRAKKENIANFTAVQGQPASTGFAPQSLDAVVVVATFSFLDHPAEMLKSISDSIKPKGMLLVVDSPREGIDASSPGMDVDEVIALADAAGFTRAGENNVVPGHYSLILRKR